MAYTPTDDLLNSITNKAVGQLVFATKTGEVDLGMKRGIGILNIYLTGS